MIRIKVRRYDPEGDGQTRYETYAMPLEPGAIVLDALNYIASEIDSTLAFSCGCRYGYCGICAIRINGQPDLACRRIAEDGMVLEPLANLSVVRDLVVERGDYDERKLALKPYLVRESAPRSEPEPILPADFEDFRVASRCIECLCCVSVCPAIMARAEPFAGPSAMVELARRIFDPRDKLERIGLALQGGLYNCSECCKCSEICPSLIPISDLAFQKVRELAVKAQVEPELLRQTIEKVYGGGKALTVLSGAPSLLEQMAGTAEIEGPVGKVAFFLGCHIDSDPRLQSAGRAAVEILRTSGWSAVVPPEQVCCGLPLKESGATAKMEKLAMQNIKALEDSGADVVITLCPGCGKTLKRDFAEIFQRLEGRGPAYRTLDLSEFLTERAKLNFSGARPLDMKVTYHDPCHLRRYQGIWAEPRRLIRSLPGVELVEMAEPDLCCGGGGELRVTNRKLAQAFARRKAEMIAATGAGAVVTPCPTCVLQLASGIHLNKVKGIRAMHLSELIALCQNDEHKL